MKPKSEWLVMEDEALRIIPQETWDRVREIQEEKRKVFPRVERGGFVRGHGSRVESYPTQLLAGLLECDACGAKMQQVSGKLGGYYGCPKGAKNACTNTKLVRRELVERAVVQTIKGVVSEPEYVSEVLHRVEAEVKKRAASSPDDLTTKERELETLERRIRGLTETIARSHEETGRKLNLRPLLLAIDSADARADELRAEVRSLRATQSRMFQAPPLAWIEDRLRNVREILSARRSQSALSLRKLLGAIRLEWRRPQVGRAYYVARTRLGVLDLLQAGGDQQDSEGERRPRAEQTTGSETPRQSIRGWAGVGSDRGSNVLTGWRRRESNPGPKAVAKDFFTCVAGGFDLGSGHAHWQAIPSPSPSLLPPPWDNGWRPARVFTRAGYSSSSPAHVVGS